MSSTEDWTTPHDLALIYIALAYGTDHDLQEEEMATLTDALREWTAMPSDPPINRQASMAMGHSSCRTSLVSLTTTDR